MIKILLLTIKLLKIMDFVKKEDFDKLCEACNYDLSIVKSVFESMFEGVTAQLKILTKLIGDKDFFQSEMSKEWELFKSKENVFLNSISEDTLNKIHQAFCQDVSHSTI
jgi:hypothetical protein